MTKKVFLTLSLLTTTLLAGGPTLAAPAAPASAPQTAPAPKPQTAPKPQKSPDIALTKEDLPSGFEEIPPELKSELASQMAIFLQQLPDAKLKPENLFAFINRETMEVVMGYTDKLANQPSQANFDAVIKQMQQPQAQQRVLALLRERLKKLKELKVEVLDYKTLSDLNNVGNGSTGLTLSLKIEDQPVRMDMVSFRRNTIAAFTAVMSLSDQQPVVKLGDVARKLDGRILQSSPAANRSQFALVR